MGYDYKEIVPYLLHWFEYNARILPWRENPSPYHVWVSEIMLQQTRVEAVKGYYERFLTVLPDVESLALCPEEKLMKLWEGLGYYSRVRNMQKAARIITEEYNGKFPSDYEKLLSLPGIGEYTAGAVASIAFGIPVPAVDGNVLRVAKRLACSYDDITKDKVRKELWKDLIEIMPVDQPGAFNQSLMELGATVCIPNGRPLCEQCPVMHLCEAFHKGCMMELPVKPAKKQRKIEKKTILLIEYQGCYAIRKRENKGLLAGLWELPWIEETNQIEALEQKLHQMGMEWTSIHSLGEAKHIFSHIEWHMTGYHINLTKLPGKAAGMKSDHEMLKETMEPNTEIEREIRKSNHGILKETTEYNVGLSKETMEFNPGKEPELPNLEFVTLEEIREVYTVPNAFTAYLSAIRAEKIDI